ncbi:MAG: hypothetical protein AB7T63_05045 [Planctomycetota bacterium]
MSGRAVLAGIVFGVVLVAGGVTRAEEDAPGARIRLPVLVDEEAESHEATVEAWLELPVPERIELAREALGGDDEAAARAASLVIGWPHLSVDEVARAAALRAQQPAWWFSEPAGPGAEEPAAFTSIGFGSVDWPVAMRAALEHSDEVSPGDIELLHRVARPAHADVLAEVVAVCPESWLAPLSLTCGVMADCDRSERHREGLARCFLAFQARRRAQQDGGASEPPRSAQPATFDAQHDVLLRAWIDGRTAAEPTEAGTDLSLRWLRRVTAARVFTEADVALLEALADAAGSQRSNHDVERHLLLTTMRKLAGLEGGKATVVSHATGFRGGTDELGEAALAAWASTGLPEARALLNREEGGWDDIDPDWRWLADRDRMRAEALDVLLEDDEGRHPQDIAQMCNAYAWGAREDERTWTGMGPDDDDVAWLGDELARRAADADVLLAWHMLAEPGSLDGERARRLLDRLEEAEAPRWVDEHGRAFGAVLVELLQLEADRIRSLLVTWARSGDGHVVEAFGPWCLRLGLDVAPEVLARGWSSWMDEDAAELGRHPDPAVEAFLRLTLVASEPDQQALAAGALLLRAGLDPRVVRHLAGSVSFLRWTSDEDENEEDEEEGGGELHEPFRGALLAGDAIGAVLALADLEEDLSFLGLLDDERVRIWLRARRDDPQSPLARQAEVALGWSGDAGEKAVLQRLVESGRTWILENAIMEGVPEGPLVETVLELLDTNCCLGWVAAETLEAMYPVVLDGDTAWGGRGTQATRERLRSFRWVKTPWDGTPTAIRATP